jgi:hypothetical protein
MRNRERTMIENAGDHLESAMDLVAAVLETRDDDEDGIGYELRILYTKINDCIDDTREIGYDI